MVAAGLAGLSLGDSSIVLVVVGVVCGASHAVLMPVLYALLLFGILRDRRWRSSSGRWPPMSGGAAERDGVASA